MSASDRMEALIVGAREVCPDAEPAPNDVELALYQALREYGLSASLSDLIVDRFIVAVEQGDEACARKFQVSLRTVKRDRALVARVSEGVRERLLGKLA
jgi:hypothetical protein